MTAQDESTTSYYRLRDALSAFPRFQKIVHLVLDEISAEVRAKLPEIELVRWQDVLFVTVAGFRVYFRFHFHPDLAQIKFGRWYTNKLGHPRFESLEGHEWTIDPTWTPQDREWLYQFRQRALSVIANALDRPEDFRRLAGANFPLRRLCTEAEYTGQPTADAHPSR
jgi:hypothetical protein